ncbi:MAG TPA: HDIG domain-containing protein [Candidatus Limnocylindrales bacterium]|nr:HDIG domain-containing protein [Candidatus Limnocylindrales bacterium]
MIKFPVSRGMRDLRAIVRTDPGARLGAFVVAFGILTAMAMLLSPPAVVAYDASEVADRSIRAPRSITFASPSLTEQERDRAAAAVPPQYARDAGVVAREQEGLAAAIAALTRVRNDTQLTREEKLSELTRLPEITLDVAQAADVLDVAVAEWETVARDVERVVQTLYAQGIRQEQLEQVRADVEKALPPTWSERQKRIGVALVGTHLAANETLDPVATARAESDARAAIPPIQVQVAVGETVVREGQVVTVQDVEKLRALGLATTGIDWRVAVGLFGWALLIAGVLGLFIERYAQEAWVDDRRVVLVGLGLLTLTVVGRVLVPAHTAVAVYFVPFAAVAMTLTILVGGRTALATQIAGALHVGIMSAQVDLVAYVLVPSLLGIAAVRRATTAREFVAGALNTAGGNLGVLGAFLLVGSRTIDLVGLLQLGLAALMSGLAAGFLAFGAVVLLGHLFRITTVFELRELADPNHPLLRQLLLRTPGTYHHSLLVANLAERAAEVVGADPLLARVGAYFHDIGKMRNPLAFIENQTGTNPHDELDPLVSAGIVSAHVRDGLALADRYHLPDQIREMIPGHHGTSVIRYFYQQAVDRGQQVELDQFRHPGPKPQTKEAGIIMLADGTEAAVRSLAEKNPETIRGMVEKIVDEKVADGQLDECDLTLRDIQRIKDAFCELLLGVYHERIPYPEDRIARLPSASPPAASDR